MKAKYFLLGFLLLTVGAFCATANTRAQDYTFDNIPPNTPGVKEITVIDEDGLEELFQPVDLDEGGQNWLANIQGTGMHPFNAPCGTYILGQLDNSQNMDDLGAKMQSQIDWINESDDYVAYDVEEAEFDEYDVWTVYSDIWSWVDPDNDFNPEPTQDEEKANLFAMDPDDLNVWTWDEEVEVEPSDMDDWEEGAVSMWTFPLSLGSTWFIMPSPVVDYLDELSWKDDDFTYETYLPAWGAHPDYAGGDEVWEDFTSEYSVDGATVTHEGSFGFTDEDGDLDVEDYIETWTYTEDRGTLDVYQLMNDDEEVLWEMSAAAVIPGYELPILLGVTAAFVIGIIYVIRKRK